MDIRKYSGTINHDVLKTVIVRSIKDPFILDLFGTIIQKGGDGTAGLKMDSLVMARQLHTISKARLKERIGSIQADELKKRIFDALSVHLEMYWE